ncbi:MAG: hypothetical protein AABX70_01655 [Nanoarchaeota archaeon]
MTPSLPKTSLVTLLLQEIEVTRLLLETMHTQKSNKKTDPQKAKTELNERVGALERYKAELYASLSNLDYEYHQGNLPYDKYKTQMACLLKNKPIEHYILKIDHLLRSCTEVA